MFQSFNQNLKILGENHTINRRNIRQIEQPLSLGFVVGDLVWPLNVDLNLGGSPRSIVVDLGEKMLVLFIGNYRVISCFYQINVLHGCADVLHGFHRTFSFHISTVESLFRMGSSVKKEMKLILAVIYVKSIN